MKDEAPVTVRGTWEFDATDSRITFTSMMNVVDGWGFRRGKWKTIKPGLASLGVEKHLSGILIGSGGEYPYQKKDQ